MLAVLQETPDEYVAQAEILKRSYIARGCGMTPHSRASDLRRRGHVIEWHGERVNGRVISYYRLVTASLSSPPGLGLPPGLESGGEESEALARPGTSAESRMSWDDTATESEDASLTLFDPPAESKAPAWA
jgi:hypothetical protein